MVKAYLRYEGKESIGIINSRECNVVSDSTGKFVLTGCVEAVSIWNLRQGTQVRVLRTPRAFDRVTQLCLKTGVEPVVAVGYSDGAVRLWNFESGALLQTLQGHRSGVSCFAFDRAGHLLASGSCDTDIVLWDIVAESGVARLRGHVDQVTAVLFWEGTGATGDAGTSARLISSSKDRFVRIWSVELQLCLQTITEHKVEVWCLALNSSQTRLVSGGADKYLRLWSLSVEESEQNSESIASFLGMVPRPNGQGSTLALEFVRPQGLSFEVLLCQGAGKTLEIFRCHDEGEVKRRQKRRKKRAALKLKKKSQTALGAALKAEEEEEAEDAGELEGPKEGADDEEEEMRGADELSELALRHASAKAVSLAWCSASSVAFIGLGNNSLESVKIVPQDESGVVVQDSLGLSAPGHRTGVRALAIAHDDSLVASASSEALKIWNSSTGRCVRTIPSGYGLCCLFVAGNEHILLGTKEGHIELYDLRVGELSQRLEVHTAAVYGLAETPDHEGFVSCSADKYVRFFKFAFTSGAATCQELAERAQELPDECLALAHSPCGKWLAVALLNHTVQVLFADTLKFNISLYGHRLPVMSLDFTSDSQMIASGSADKNIKLWSTQFGNTLRSLRAHEESVMHVRFLPGTHYLVSASRDRTVKLWDCDSYELITALQGHATEIHALALAKDAAFVVTAGGDRQIRFWRRSQEQLFISEERAKELEDRFEQEVEREDVQVPGGAQVTLSRPSRRTVESVRTTERLIEVLDEAEGGVKDPPALWVMRYVNTLNASNIYEVLLCMPFGHAFRLLNYISDFFEAVLNMPCATGPAGRQVEETKLLSAAATLETPCQAALITAYVHHAELAATSKARTLLLRLRTQMRELLQAEKDRIGFAVAGVAQLQRTIKRATISGVTPPTETKSKSAPATGKKRKR